MINVGVIGSGFIVPEFIKATQAVKDITIEELLLPLKNN